MELLKVKMKHCYGIKAFEDTFDFKKGTTFAIYAPNGSMKSSFAKTFRDAQRNKITSDQMFPNRITERFLLGENGKSIEGEQILVVLSYDEEFGPNDKTCSLLVNPILRDKYTKLHVEVEIAKDSFISALKAQSKIRTNIEAEISSAIMQNDDRFIDAIRRVKLEVNEMEDSPWKDLPYDIVFNNKNLEAIKQNGIDEFLEEYVNRYNELLEKSNFFKGGLFDYYHATEIAKNLTKNGFFKAKHTVRLNHSGSVKDIINEKDLENLIENEKKVILEDENLKKTFDKIEMALNKNIELRDFRQYLMNNPNVISQLKNIAHFRQEVWKSYFKFNEDKFNNLIEKYEIAEFQRKEIEQKAAEERTQWEDVIDIFNSRFIVPFTIQAKNRVGLVLGEKGINLEFIYNDGNETVSVQKKELLTVLSMGERRALYILNVIFEIETRKKNGSDTLLIIDDIADSFDYQNKYAIIQYLKEIGETENFKQIILTHNFDFFRTIQSRGVASYNKCLVVKKNSQGVKLEPAEGIQNVFVNDWKKNFFVDNNKKIASIPFLRNLIEFSKGKNEDNYLLLTSMIHWKIQTNSIKVSDLDKVYADVCGGESKSENENDLIIDIIKNQSDICAKNPDSMGLSEKVVLSIGIRLAAEKHMINMIDNPNITQVIKENQTHELFKIFKSRFETEKSIISIIGRVSLMTPENIHLNSFMYEPILDMSADHLCKLYEDVKNLN